MPDHYTYPGTEVLVNIPGYTDPGAWKEAETAVVGLRMRELALRPVAGGFDLGHLQAIHVRLVEELYTWGGRLRDTDTGPGGTGIAHCRPEFISAEAARVFEALADADYLRRRDRAGFCRGLAWTWGEVTAIHPFRDVNTRSQFMFFNQLAAEAGWVIDWAGIDPYLFAHARTRAITVSEDGIDALLHPALFPAHKLAQGEVRQRTASSVAEFTRPRSPRQPSVLDRELRSAIQRRRNYRDPDPHFGPGGRRGPQPPDLSL